MQFNRVQFAMCILSIHAQIYDGNVEYQYCMKSNVHTCIVNEHLNSVGLWMTLLYLSLGMQNSLCHLILSILHVVGYVSCCNMLYQNEVKNDDVNLLKNGFPKDTLPKLTNNFLCNCKFLIFPLIGVATFC